MGSRICGFAICRAMSATVGFIPQLDACTGHTSKLGPRRLSTQNPSSTERNSSAVTTDEVRGRNKTTSC